MKILRTSSFIKVYVLVFMFTSLYSCKTKETDKKQDRFYFLGDRIKHPSFINKPIFDTSELVSIQTEWFDDYQVGRFYEYVIKFKNRTFCRQFGVLLLDKRPRNYIYKAEILFQSPAFNK